MLVLLSLLVLVLTLDVEYSMVRVIVFVGLLYNDCVDFLILAGVVVVVVVASRRGYGTTFLRRTVDRRRKPLQ